MALSSTIYNFDIALSDMDRGVYEALALRVAKHPTETDEYMLTRVLAYCLEYRQGIELAKALDDPDQPAVWARDYAGQLTVWVEVGMPDAAKLHRASKIAERVAIYTHRDPTNLRRALRGRTIYRADHIALFAFDGSFLAPLTAELNRRMKFDLSVTEHHVYLQTEDIGIETVLLDHRIT